LSFLSADRIMENIERAIELGVDPDRIAERGRRGGDDDDDDG
jgi:hypothetical protein